MKLYTNLQQKIEDANRPGKILLNFVASAEGDITMTRVVDPVEAATLTCGTRYEITLTPVVPEVPKVPKVPAK